MTQGSAAPAVRAGAADAVPLLQELIRAACVNDGSDGSGQEIRNVRILARYLEGLPIEVEVVEPMPGRANLIATLRGSDPAAGRLALVGHIDVVPVDREGWLHDPFAAEIIDGELWGRGAVDMLNFTAAMAVAFRMVAESGTTLAGDLVFAATADEEAGSRYGMKWLFEHRPELVTADFALTESGGGIPIGPADARAVTITTGQKGSAGRRVRVRGESGHGSMPYGVRNGAVLAAEAVTRIAAIRPAPVIPDGGWWAELLRALGFAEPLRARLCDPATVDEALPETGSFARMLHALTHMTLSPNVVTAGTKSNVIPAEGVIDLDIRLLPGQTGEDAERELRDALASLDAVVRIEPGKISAEALETARDDRLYAVLCEVIEEFYPGATPLPLLTPGGNDARQYLGRGIPCYGFGMFSPDMDMAEFRKRFHGDNERIDVRSVELCAAAYVRIAELLLAAGDNSFSSVDNNS